MNADSTLLGFIATAARRGTRLSASTDANGPDTAARVAAVIARRACAAGLSDVAYFGEIVAGRAPRITRAEVAREPLPTAPPRPGRAVGEAVQKVH
jgi:hypothetical protein